MSYRRFQLAANQWSRFIQIITPSLGELLFMGLLNEAADHVDLEAGHAKNDIKCTLDGRDFTVEVKTAWWHDTNRTLLGHSPLRENQHPDLGALFGQFDVDPDSASVRELDAGGITVADDRLFYLLPTTALQKCARPDGRSLARSLALERELAPFEVDLSVGLTGEGLLNLLSQ